MTETSGIQCAIFATFPSVEIYLITLFTNAIHFEVCLIYVRFSTFVNICNVYGTFNFCFNNVFFFILSQCMPFFMFILHLSELFFYIKILWFSTTQRTSYYVMIIFAFVTEVFKLRIVEFCEKKHRLLTKYNSWHNITMIGFVKWQEAKHFNQINSTFRRFV